MDKTFKTVNIFFAIIVFFIVSIILLSTLVKEGMFMDGLIYSTISRNISLGIGSLWYPKFTETIYPIFNEHPPLVFGIQSLFFKLLGTSIYTERFYSFFTAIVTLFLIKKIWFLLFTDNTKHLWWYPVLLWIITPVVFWSYSNNMLECTMGIFTMLGVFFSIKYLKTESKIKYIYLFLISISIVLGFLSKGFPALFPLTTIAIYWLIFKKPKFTNTLLSSLSILFIVIIIFYLIMLNTNVYNNLSTYFSSQVMESISGSRNPGSRMFIIIRMMRELLPMFIFSTIIILISTKFKIRSIIKLENNKIFFFSLFIGLSASLPVAISPKQMGFYIIPAFPFFAIAFASISVSYLKKWIQKIKKLKILKISTLVFVIILASTIYFSFGEYSRDKKSITDIKKLGNIIPENTKVSVYIDFYQNWGFISYLYRYDFISIDRDNINRPYYLMTKDKQMPEKNYKKVDVKFNEFDLYKKIENDK